MVVLTIGAANQSTKIRAGSLNVKLNTLDVVLKAPAVRPVEGDVVTLDSPAWSGVVISVETSDPVERLGVPLMVTVSATNQAEALASQAPFGVSDAPTNGNILSANQASVETDVTGWQVTVNCTIAQTAAQAHDGTKSLQLTSVAAGDMAAQDSTGLVVAPNQPYTATGWVRSAVSARSCRLDLFWFKADGVTPSSVRASDAGTSVADSAAAWTALPALTATSPSDAAFAVIKVRVLATGAGAEVHYFDQLGVGFGPDTTWRSGGTTPTVKFTQLKVKTQRNSDGTLSVQGSCRIQTPGLWPAMTFLLTSSNQGIAAASYSITNVGVSWPTRDHPVLAVDFGDPIVTMSVWLNSNPGPVLPITTTKITDGAVSTPKLAAGSVTADKLEATLILASLIKAGIGTQHVEMDQAGIRAYDSSGNLIVNIPNDGSPVYINAQIVAQTLAVTGNAVFQGSLNEFALGSTTQLDGSQGNPTLAPTLAQGWDTVSIPLDATVDGTTMSRIGLCYDAAGGAGGATKVFWGITNSTNGHQYAVELLASDRSLNRSIDLGTNFSVYSVCKMGSEIYVVFFHHPAAQWRVYRYDNATLNNDAQYNAVSFPVTPNFPTLCSDGTNVFIVDTQFTGGIYRIKWNKYDASMVKVGATIDTTYGEAASAVVASAAGSFDLGAFRILTAHISTVTTIHSFDSTGARQANEEFPSQGGDPYNGITYGDALGDGARFWSGSGGSRRAITKHSTWTWTTASSVYWVAYTWYDSNATGGTHETQVGPRRSITMGRRKNLTMTAQSIPGAGGADDPNNIRFYMAPNATDPGATGLKLQTTQAAPTFVATTYASGGAADPGANSFAAGAAAILQSQTGGLLLKGDGTAQFGTGLKATIYRARAYRAAAMNLTSNSAFVVVLFDTESYDPNNNFDPVTTRAYTIPVAGLYRVDARVSWAATVRTLIAIFANAAEVDRGEDSGATAFQRGYVVGGDYVFAAGDVVDVRVQMLDNVAHAFDVGQAVCWFSIRFLGG